MEKRSLSKRIFNQHLKSPKDLSLQGPLFPDTTESQAVQFVLLGPGLVEDGLHQVQLGNIIKAELLVEQDDPYFNVETASAIISRNKPQRILTSFLWLFDLSPGSKLPLSAKPSLYPQAVFTLKLNQL